MLVSDVLQSDSVIYIMWLSDKEFTYQCRRHREYLIPGSGRSPGEGDGHPLQSFCLENPMDRGAWQLKVHGDAKSQTQLSN